MFTQIFLCGLLLCGIQDDVPALADKSKFGRPSQINNNGSADDGSVGGSGGVVIPQR